LGRFPACFGKKAKILPPSFSPQKNLNPVYLSPKSYPVPYGGISDSMMDTLAEKTLQESLSNRFP
jgi:hypothetical protein